MRYLILIMLLTGCASKPIEPVNQKGVTVEKISCTEDSCLFVTDFDGNKEIVSGHVRTHVPQIVWRTCIDGVCGGLKW